MNATDTITSETGTHMERYHDCPTSLICVETVADYG
jgi:hypothetical protein